MKKFILAFLFLISSFSLFAEESKDSVLNHQNLQSLGLSDKAIEKLSADQIVKLVSNQQRQQRFHPSGDQRKHIMVPFFVFFSVATSIGLALFFNYKKSISLHRLIYKSIEAGVPFPFELLTKVESGKRASDFKKGVILVAAGAGITLTLFIEGLVWSIGLVPLLIGAGFLLVHKLEKPTALKNDSIQNG